MNTCDTSAANAKTSAEIGVTSLDDVEFGSLGAGHYVYFEGEKGRFFLFPHDLKWRGATGVGGEGPKAFFDTEEAAHAAIAEALA